MKLAQLITLAACALFIGCGSVAADSECEGFENGNICEIISESGSIIGNCQSGVCVPNCEGSLVYVNGVCTAICQPLPEPSNGVIVSCRNGVVSKLI